MNRLGAKLVVNGPQMKPTAKGLDEDSKIVGSGDLGILRQAFGPCALGWARSAKSGSGSPAPEPEAAWSELLRVSVIGIPGRGLGPRREPPLLSLLPPPTDLPSSFRDADLGVPCVVCRLPVCVASSVVSYSRV